MSALKILVAVYVFACVSVVSFAEECIYDDRGLCIEPCPPDTYSYSPGCQDDTMSQRTCRQPRARSLGQICDYSRCDCREPKLWDEAAQKCVMYKDCTDQSKIKNDDMKI